MGAVSGTFARKTCRLLAACGLLAPTTTPHMALARLRAAQRALIDEYRAEYFCDDLDVPASAFGWDEKAIREYLKPAEASVATTATMAKLRLSSTRRNRRRRPLLPRSSRLVPLQTPPQPPPTRSGLALCSSATRSLKWAASSAEAAAAAAAAVGGGGTVGGGGGGGGSGGGGTSTLAMPVVPDGYFATIGAQCPEADDGPGWGVLLAHNYLSLRRTCDVLNRCVCTRQQSRLRPSLTHAGLLV